MPLALPVPLRGQVADRALAEPVAHKTAKSQSERETLVAAIALLDEDSFKSECERR